MLSPVHFRLDGDIFGSTFGQTTSFPVKRRYVLWISGHMAIFPAGIFRPEDVTPALLPVKWRHFLLEDVTSGALPFRWRNFRLDFRFYDGNSGLTFSQMTPLPVLFPCGMSSWILLQMRWRDLSGVRRNFKTTKITTTLVIDVESQYYVEECLLLTFGNTDDGRKAHLGRGSACSRIKRTENTKRTQRTDATCQQSSVYRTKSSCLPPPWF